MRPWPCFWLLQLWILPSQLSWQPSCALPLFLSALLPCYGVVDAALFLPQHALRIEITDAAALAAGSRIDDRIDRRRLAVIHRRCDGALGFVREGSVGADPS